MIVMIMIMGSVDLTATAPLVLICLVLQPSAICHKESRRRRSVTRGRINMAGTAGMQKLNSMKALFDRWAGSSDKILVRGET